MDIDVRSEGCDDPGIAPGTCGIAYIKVNGRDYSPHGRGHNVVILDAGTGNVMTKQRVPNDAAKQSTVSDDASERRELGILVYFT